MLVTDQFTLDSLCKRLSDEHYITVDTEFIRERTYYPQLCLVQLGGEKEAWAIDALAPALDLTPLFSLFTNPKVLKVFHSARQDIEIILHLSGAIPTPIFDTQIAAMVCGFGEAASYETLVNKLTGKGLDKSCRFSDWSHRPLSEAQLTYALSDVTHLRTVYEKLQEQIDTTKRAHWLNEEMGHLTNSHLYFSAPEDAWKKIRLRSHAPQFVQRVKALACWREHQARAQNVPRGHILTDPQLLEIAASSPKKPQDILSIRSIARHQQHSEWAHAILSALSHINDFSPTIAAGDQPLSPGGGPLVDLLKVLLKFQCDQHGVAEKLIASSSELAKIAHYQIDDCQDIPALHGWRYEIFGQYALALKDGKLALAADKDTMKILWI